MTERLYVDRVLSEPVREGLTRWSVMARKPGDERATKILTTVNPWRASRCTEAAVNKRLMLLTYKHTPYGEELEAVTRAECRSYLK
jgi:hypothetical protein